MNEAAVLSALLRSDLRFFVRKSFQTILPGTAYLPNWHVDAIVHQLMRVHAGDIPRLLINQPPRSLKSICVSVAYVAWLLGHDPTRRVVVVSYSNELAAELHRQFRMVIDAPWYQALFPAMRPAKDSGTELVISNIQINAPVTSTAAVTKNGAIQEPREIEAPTALVMFMTPVTVPLDGPHASLKYFFEVDHCLRARQLRLVPRRHAAVIDGEPMHFIRRELARYGPHPFESVVAARVGGEIFELLFQVGRRLSEKNRRPLGTAAPRPMTRIAGSNRAHRIALLSQMADLEWDIGFSDHQIG